MGIREPRRTVLSAAGAALFSLCGCLGDSDGSEPTDDSSPTPSSPTPSDGARTSRATRTRTETPSRTSAPQDVAFEAPHGATIRATRYGTGDCAVVLVPQINMDRGSWEPQAELLAEMGHLALAIDEDPDDRPSSILGAIRHLRTETGVERVALVGASSGGEAVVVANAEADAGAVDGTMTLSAGGGTDRAADLQGRLLFVVSEGDDDRFVRVARELHDAAPPPKDLVTYDGDAHGQRIFDSAHGEDLRERLRSFVREVCSG